MKRWLPVMSWGVCLVLIGYERRLTWPNMIGLIVSLLVGMFVAYEDAIFPKTPTELDGLKAQVADLNNAVARLSMVYGIKGNPTDRK